jgi:arginase
MAIGDGRREIALIGAPSSAGARRIGQDRAPAVLRARGLAAALRAAGVDLEDRGDLPGFVFTPDPDHPHRQNLDPVIAMALRTADAFERALADARRPLVLGGDCTLTLGAIAGALRRHPRLGLVYFDGDLDLNTPDTTPSGIFDGMVMTHILGRGESRLAALGGKPLLLREEAVVLFGYNRGAGFIDPPEIAAVESSRLLRFPLEAIRPDAPAAARDALGRLRSVADAILVHFDVDVMEFPAADLPHPHGLDPDAAFEALRLFVNDPACIGVVVTEFNPDHDPDGVHADRLIRGLAAAFAAPPRR